MDLVRYLVLFTLLAFLCSCGGGGDGVADTDKRGGSGQAPISSVPPDLYGPGAEDPEPIEWRLLYSWPSAYQKTPLEAVARTEQEFAALWSLCMGQGPGVPEIDFEQKMVVAVFVGDYPGHSDVRITNIARFKRGEGVLVEYVHTVVDPARYPPLPGAVGQPYYFAVADRVDADAKFVGTVNIVPGP